MKTTTKFVLLTCIGLATIYTACSGEDSNGGGSSLSTYITAKVDGADFKTYSIQGHSLGVSTRSGTGDSSLITVSCSDGQSLTATDVRSINLAIVGITTPGTYTINSDSQSIISYVDSATQVSWDTSDCSGATATVEITVLNETKIEGTFSFTGKDDDNCSSQKVVTNGKFRGTYMN